MQPGVYRRIENSAYHSGPGDSKSGLDLVHQSPAHLRAAQISTEPRKSTASQALGSAFHCLVLEPDVFAATYCLPFLPPEGALKTVDDMKEALEAAGVKCPSKAKKSDYEDAVRRNLPDAVLLSDLRAAYDDANDGREELTAEAWEQIHRMRDAVMAHPAASKLLSGKGEPELSCYWMEPVVDPLTGTPVLDEDGKPVEVLLRCRPDFWRYDGILVDLKSTQPEDAEPESFAHSLHKWRYYVQDALYKRGTAAALAHAGEGFEMFKPTRAFVFVAVENDACVVEGVAKGVAVYQLQPDSVALGEAEMREDVFTLYQCRQAGRFHGYAETIQPIELPPYAFTKAAARMGIATRDANA